MHYAINDIVGSVLFGTISQFSAFDREIISSSKRCKNLSHSERSPTKELLISSEKIIDCLNDGVYVCDRDRRIVFWNKSAERITGWRSEDGLGRACLEDIFNHLDRNGYRLCGEKYCPLHRAMISGVTTNVPIIGFVKPIHAAAVAKYI